MKVIDSSSLVKFFSKEDGWEAVRELILEGVVSLDLSVKEVANALWRKVLKGDMEIHDAVRILGDLYQAEVIKMDDQRRYLSKAFEIAAKNRITVYDALFIALAEELNTRLITSDVKQAEIAEIEGVDVIFV